MKTDLSLRRIDSLRVASKIKKIVWPMSILVLIGATVLGVVPF